MVPSGVMLEDRVPHAARSQPCPKADLVTAWLQKLVPVMTWNLSAEAEEQFSPGSPRQEVVLLLPTCQQTSRDLPWCGQQCWHTGTDVHMLRWHFALLSTPGEISGGLLAGWQQQYYLLPW